MSAENAVTPQMYGAKADGITDDTEAFQKAVNSGYDVFVPTARRQTYRITRPIVITKKQCKRIFSEPYARRADTGAIVADFSDSAEPRATCLFDVHIQLFHIGGIRFNCKAVGGRRVGIFLNAMDDICDYDIKLDHCCVTGFYRVACFTGRGFEIGDSTIASCQYLADLYWDDEKDTNKNHPAQYDQRAIRVTNSRLHSIGSGFLNVHSGHAYGLHFHGNTIDNGRGYLIRAYEQAYGWNITGNVVQGIQGNFDVLDLRKGMRNCVVSGNTFTSDKGYWVGSDGTVESWVRCAATTTGSAIVGNVFVNTGSSFMSFMNISGCTIVGNVMRNQTASTEPAICIRGKCENTTITGNAVTCSDDIPLLSKDISKKNMVVGNIPNA